jgi:hypothetical protein
MIVRFVLLAALASEALGKLDVQLDDASSDAASSNITLLDAAPSLLFKRATAKEGLQSKELWKHVRQTFQKAGSPQLHQESSTSGDGARCLPLGW